MARLALRGRAAALLACAAGAALAALDWPLSSPSLAATFGTAAPGGLVTGLALASAGGLVRAVEGGEILFCSDGPGGRSPLPSALGSFVIVEHARQVAGVYSHLAPGSASDYLRKVRPGDILGAAGASGWTEGEGLLFQAFDRKEGRWVNPLLLLPPLGDDKPPVIRSLSLLRAGKSYPLGETRSLGQGVYGIALEASDPSAAPWTAGPLAPYSIRLVIDGALAARCVFDVARASGGELVFFSEGPRAAAALRGGEGRYVLAERLLARGKVVFEVQVEDAAGNRRSASWSVLVE